MSNLLEILGRAITVDTAELIWNWFNIVRLSETGCDSEQYEQLDNFIELISQKKNKAAEQQLRFYLFENPSCIRGRMASGTLALQDNQLTKAIEEFNSVYMRQPSNTMVLYALGHCYERLGNQAQAVEFYQDCLKFKSYLQLPRQRLAAIYFKNGQLEKTVGEYELLRNEYPEDITTLLALGHLYIATGKYTKAIDTFNTAILVHPDSFQGDDDQIDHLMRQGQMDQVQELIESLLEKEPDRPDLIMKNADILSMFGETREAITQYERLVHICPDHLEATIKLGSHYLKLQEDERAAHQFNLAFEINERVVEAYIGLAAAQKIAKYYDEALNTLSLTASIQPNSSLLLVHTTALYLKLSFNDNIYMDDEPYDSDDQGGQIKIIIDAYQRKIHTNPQNPDLHYRLGIFQMNLSNLHEAIKCFETVLRINPTFSRASHKLAVCLFESNMMDEALDQLTPPSVIDSATLQLHYKTALLYCDKIKFASSLLNLENTMQGNLTETNAVINTSIVLQNLGLLDRASEMWENLSGITGTVE